MLRVTPSESVHAAKSYFDAAFARDDYYTAGDGEIEVVGRWGGKGAAMLGLHGLVDRESFHQLCDNVNPVTLKKLTQRNKDNRIPGYDFTFSVSKSYSILYGMTSSEALMTAFRAAVAATMEKIEAEMETRVRKDGQDSTRTTGNLIYGEFIHKTARPVDGKAADPHLHAHIWVPNATFDPVEQKIKAGYFKHLMENRPYWEAVFENLLACKLKELGLAIERVGKSWEIAGLDDPALLAKFSNRTQEINAIAKAKGITDADEKGKLGAMSRKAKDREMSWVELVLDWLKRLTSGEREAIKAVERGEGRSLSPEITPGRAVEYAVAHVFERASVVTEKQLMETAIRFSTGSNTAEEIQAEVRRAHNGIIGVDFGGIRHVSTREVFAEEERMVDWAVSGQKTRPALAPGRAVPEMSADGLSLPEEKQAAVRFLWESTDKLMLVHGGAGVGKTTMMKVAVAGIEATSGKKVYSFAPSAEASRGVQRAEGFADADTVQRLLVDVSAQEKLRDQVVWVDEAATLGTRQMGKLFELAERLNFRLILTGDHHQHSSVERGDAFRILHSQAFMHSFEVKEIMRQKGALKAAVEALAKGEMVKGYERLEALGCIREISGEERHLRLAADYLDAVSDRKSALVVAPTHAEKDAVTAIIRENLRAQGVLAGEERTFPKLVNRGLTEAERKEGRHYAPGDTIVFNQNAKGYKKGERLSVLGRDERGTVQVRGANGDVVPLPLSLAERFGVYQSRSVSLAAGDKIRFTAGGTTLDGKHKIDNGAVYPVAGFDGENITLGNGWVVGKEHGHIDLGYASTSHASQGKTVDRVMIACGAESFVTTSREQFYVSCSRARQQVTVYTDSPAELKKRIQASGERLSALELVHGKPNDADAATLAREAAEKAVHYRRMLDAVNESAPRENSHLPEPPMPPVHPGIFTSREAATRSHAYER